MLNANNMVERRYTLEQEFRGKWIQTSCWTAEDAAQARLVCFRGCHSLRTKPESFPLRITAAGRYKLYVNGAFVECGPAKGDGNAWYYDAVDLAPWLHEGENVIAVSLLAYPLDGEKGNHSLFRFDRPRLYLEGLTAEGWRCRIDRGVSFPPEETRFAPLQVHERAVGDLRLLDWKQPGFHDDEWDEAQLCPEAELPAVLLPSRLQPRPIPFMERRQRSFALPISQIPPHSEESFVLDAGEETCAFLTLETSGGCGAVIELLESEAYVLPEGKGDRCDSVNGHLEGYTDVYTAAGAEQEVYEPFWFRTFRFLQVTIRTAEEPLSIRALNYKETGYPLEVKTTVETSDPSLSAIWDISLRTLRRCMHETYMDCPFYEQLQYAMDTRSEILYTYAVSADDRLARQAIDDFRRAQRPDGLLNCSYPNVNVNVIPGFSLYYILMVHDHMMYFGDRELVCRNLPAIARVLDFFAAHRTAEGLVDKVGGVNGQAPFWSFIDWAEPWMSTEGMPTAGLQGPITMESLLLLLGLQKAAELAARVGDEREHDYRRQAEMLKAAIRSHCMNADGMLTDGPGCAELSQHCQVFGVLSGVLTKEEGRRNLLRALSEPGITRCTVAMCFYLFRALEETGLYAYTDRYWEIWRRMLRNHCTTCVEGEYYPRSECHAWGALALYELPSAVLGVRPAAPGYEKILVDPQQGALRSASGTVHTPKGDIFVSWHLEDDGVQTEIRCDENVRKRIVAKSGEKRQIKSI
jgi:hypothetical protein